MAKRIEFRGYALRWTDMGPGLSKWDRDTQIHGLEKLPGMKINLMDRDGVLGEEVGSVTKVEKDAEGVLMTGMIQEDVGEKGRPLMGFSTGDGFKRDHSPGEFGSVKECSVGCVIWGPGKKD